MIRMKAKDINLWKTKCSHPSILIWLNEALDKTKNIKGDKRKKERNLQLILFSYSPAKQGILVKLARWEFSPIQVLLLGGCGFVEQYTTGKDNDTESKEVI